jgi:hypothetical protein
MLKPVKYTDEGEYYVFIIRAGAGKALFLKLGNLATEIRRPN